MANSQEQPSLSTLARGAVIERFDDELGRVLSNILDPNTDVGAREITIKAKLAPNDERDRVDLVIGCSSKMGSAKAVKTVLYVGRNRDGSVEAQEFDPKQPSFEFDNETPRSNNIQHLNRVAP